MTPTLVVALIVMLTSGTNDFTSCLAPRSIVRGTIHSDLESVGSDRTVSLNIWGPKQNRLALVVRRTMF
ncbi:MAG: hypothetical protein ACJAYU_001293 [Bradymonadia bacterium]|jgi:hypothetical protein